MNATPYEKNKRLVHDVPLFGGEVIDTISQILLKPIICRNTSSDFVEAIFATGCSSSGLLVLIVEALLLSGSNIVGVLVLLGAVVLVLELLRSLGEVLLKATGGLGLVRIGGGLSLGGLGLADFDVAIRMLEEGSLLVERSGAIELTPARGFSKLIDAIDGDVVLGDGAVNVFSLAFLELAGQGITTLLALLAAVGDGHGDEAGDEEQEEEADDAKGDGQVEGFVVGGISHDDDGDALWEKI